MRDEKAQRQVRAMRAKLEAERPDKVQIDPAYGAEVYRQKERETAFKVRRQEVAARAAADASRHETFARDAERLETYGGYLETLKSMTVAGVERAPSPEEWMRLRDDRRAIADRARESRYASGHASAMLAWAEGKPDALKLAVDTTKGQLMEARQAMEAAAIEVNRLWTQSPGSHELAQAQSVLVERQKVVDRFEESLRLLEKGA